MLQIRSGQDNQGNDRGGNRGASGIEQHIVLKLLIAWTQKKKLCPQKYRVSDPLPLVSAAKNQLQNSQHCSKFISALIIDKEAQPVISNIIHIQNT